METDAATDALDDALVVFAGTAPNYGRLGLANHGPMAAEALVHLGRADALPDWVARYAKRLDAAPPPARRPLTEAEWQDALGDEARYPEWLALFEREVADRPPAAVVGEWVPRLLPGIIGAATHGLIRTGHALRGLGAADTQPRRLEVATALAFWASSYQELPGPPLLIGSEDVAQALADLPYLPEDAPAAVLISDRVAAVNDIADEFEQAVASLGWSGGAFALLDPLAAGGATAYLRNADDGGAIGLLHSVTSPLACELVLPWLAEEDRAAALGYAWQAAAALHVAYDTDRVTPVPRDAPPEPAELIDRAIASGDEHAIKLCEAALRAFGRCSDPAFLLAAADAAARL
ncbi:MAG TPA: questin oxidase family protein [Acidimicrobiales bacterium]|nr:questin oxidase family protein [Acidimicrobiales bacterium]